jgi:hypothetical protein
MCNEVVTVVWQLLPALLLAEAAAAAATAAATTSGLSIVFASNATPVSVKNAQGEELLGVGSSGFTLMCTPTNHGDKTRPNACPSRSSTPFDTMTPHPSRNAFTFGVTASGEQLDVVFDGANHYLTANITATRGFEWGDGKAVSFGLIGKGTANDGALRGMGLNFMIDGGGGEGQGFPSQPSLHYEAPWVNTTWNPHARFAVWERVDDATEDETLYDLWVDEGLPHPRVSGSWDRPAAKAWVKAWTASVYDSSQMAMVPHNISEWREFFPYGELMEANTLWFNFREWSGSSIDNVDPKMFPSGVPGFKSFSDDAAKNGFKISSHRMSGGLMPDDPDYCVKPDPGLLGWGDMHLVSDGAVGVTRVVVKPLLPGAKIPVKALQKNMSTEVYMVVSAGLGACSIGEEWLTYQSIAPLPDGNWEILLSGKTTAAHPAGALVRGYIKGNEYFLPDLFSPLYEEVAVRYANFSNLVRFADGNFDGAGWFTWYGHWAFFKFASLVYENLDHPTTVHTSGLVPSSSWPEYHFNSVRDALGGSFTTTPGQFGSIALQAGCVGLDAPSLDGVAITLTVGLAVNTRSFTVGHDLRSTLDVYNGSDIGNVKDLLALVKDFKRGSLSMGTEQRSHMSTVLDSVKRAPRGHYTSINATWMPEGDIFRKWISTGTADYDYKAYSSSSFVPPRFYAQSGKRVALLPPAELQAGHEYTKVVGRLLPRFAATSSQNIDLLAKMKLGSGSSLQLTASNPSSVESFSAARLKEYLPPGNISTL